MTGAIAFASAQQYFASIQRIAGAYAAARASPMSSLC
jgi:hypothetical protein